MKAETAGTGDSQDDTRYLFLLVFTLLSGALVYFVLVFSSSLPLADDYADILLSMVRIREADSFAEVFPVIFSQHTMHITAYNRLISLAWLTVFGEIDFRGLIVIGNLHIVALAVLCLSGLPRLPERTRVAVVFCLLFLHPASGVTALWAMTSISNYGVWLSGFAALTLAWRYPDSWKLCLAVILLGSLSAMTLGSGVFVLPLCAGVYFYRCGSWPQRIVFALVALALSLWYLQLLTPVNPHLLEARSKSMEMALASPWIALQHCSSILGSFLGSSQVLAVFLGLCGLAYLTGRLFQSRVEGPSLQLWMLLLVAGSVAAVSVARLYPQAVMTDGSAISRYAFYSQLFWSVLFLDLAVLLSGRFSPEVFRAALLCFSFGAVLLLAVNYLASSREGEARIDDIEAYTRFLLLRKEEPVAQGELDALDIIERSWEQSVFDMSAAFETVDHRVEKKPPLCSGAGVERLSGATARLDATRAPNLFRLDGELGTSVINRNFEVVLCRKNDALVLPVPLMYMLRNHRTLDQQGNAGFTLLLRYKGDIKDFERLVVRKKVRRRAG